MSMLRWLGLLTSGLVLLGCQPAGSPPSDNDELAEEDEYVPPTPPTAAEIPNARRIAPGLFEFDQIELLVVEAPPEQIAAAMAPATRFSTPAGAWRSLRPSARSPTPPRMRASGSRPGFGRSSARWISSK